MKTQFTGALLVLSAIQFFFFITNPKQVEGRHPAGFVSPQNRGWKLTLYDNFSEPSQAAVEAARYELDFSYDCFQRSPRCEYPFWSYRECDQWQDKSSAIYKNLKNLNKCTWFIYNKYNWMDFNIPEGEGVNSFHASQVKVANGLLHLKANKNPSWPSNKNCKTPMFLDGNKQYSIDCPIISGAISTEPWGQHNPSTDEWEFGFEQPYGRWEVRAKLPDGPGIWPAFWMLPVWSNPNPDPVENTGGNVACGWPHNGEIDVLETWSNAPHQPKQGYIHGNCGKDLDVRQGGFTLDGLNLKNDWHTYAVEWDPNYIKFLIDDKETGVIWKGDKLKATHRSGPDEGKSAPKEKAWIPSYPFHWILNLSIEGTKKKESLKPQYDTWKEQEVIIDYVKVFRRCTQQEFEQDIKRGPLKRLCHHFGTDSSSADSYQSTKNETAFAEMYAYPNPYKMGVGDIKVEFRLDQDCDDVKIDIVNVLGQVIHPGHVDLQKESQEIQPAGHYFHDGPLRGDPTDPNLLYTFRFTPNRSTAAGTYIIRAEFSSCDTPSGYKSGRGNYVWKQVIIK